MAKQGFIENDFQHGMFVPFLTSNPDLGLSWIKGDQMRMSGADRARWICSEDLLHFIREGNERNAEAFKQLLPQFKDEADLFESFLNESLLPKVASSGNAARLLRETIGFRDVQFRLWNEAPKVGQNETQKLDFLKNRGRVFTELSFERTFTNAGLRFNRRPDATFFVNGIYLGAAELKTAQTGQSAGVNGRKKIAHDLIELAQMALKEARALWNQTSAAPWPGYASDKLPAVIRNKIDVDCAVYIKACHVVAVDMGALYVTSDLEWVVADVDRILSGQNQAMEFSKLSERVVDKISRAPEIMGMTPFETITEHLESLYSLRDGVDREAFYFNQTWSPNSSNKQSEPLKPRPAQRIMLHRTVKRVRELYANECKPKISESDIRQELALMSQGLSAKEVDEIVEESLKYKNGAKSHSVLLQGAAGLGKTYLIVWLAQALYEMNDAKGHGYQPLFDQIILLTDRTELRANIAKDAANLGSTSKIIEEAETFADLRRIVEAGTNRIVVVNIQKFASLSKLAQEDATLSALLRSKRVAILIDEVHRSQNGVMHDATLELFNDWNSLTPDDNKRNLIIGLTATPKDEALASFGEWRRPAAPGDRYRWAPFASYSMAQAIKDGVVLNPIQSIFKFSDELVYDLGEIQSSVDAKGLTASALKAPTSDAVYENPSRQRLVAEKIAGIFVSKTMMAIRRRGLLVGEGKAMVACASIKAAVAMQAYLKEAMQTLANDPAYKDRSAHIAACPVLILYSDKQGETPCSQLNGGKSQKAILDEFRRKGVEEINEPGKIKCRNAIIIVVDMLLTGFDEKTLHTLFINRNLDDVALFQAACRINRTNKNKHDCLIVDFSREGVVSKNLPLVFAKYGGLTVSALDAMHMNEKMDAAWKAFFGDKDINSHFQTWKATLAGGKDHHGAVKLSDWLDQLVQSDKSRALLLKKAGAAWVGSREKLMALLDFDRQGLTKHKDQRQVDFVQQVVKHLAAKGKAEDESIDVLFDVIQVEQTETYELDVLGESGPQESHDSKRQASIDANGLAITDIESSLEVIDILRVLELEETKKAQAIQALRDFVHGLFIEIEACGAKDDRVGNSGFYRKALTAWLEGKSDFPWDDRLQQFNRLFNKARSSAKFTTSDFARVALTALSKRSEMLMDDYDHYISNKKTI
ncbi:DEAD/DEAH box helicase family protein [Rhodoferax aquaticus]|uniref:Type I restriction endonuclease subunit R n=1 Tax=Rhodoferax aquaticus TaxID=2527691 RepID=A0A515EQQ9_9BURK|nr:DEAD/DEAH box helicase family protein [Rhodoferax aquaticus]QDL54994.1 type I restriction endonuclease subunit R [Rhodoferax aquaticus]